MYGRDMAETPGADVAPRGLTKVTVNLTPKAFDALQEAALKTGDTKTDTINRALQVYKHILELHEAGGGGITLQRIAGGPLERLTIL
jgi:hypothetical protein